MMYMYLVNCSKEPRVIRYDLKCAKGHEFDSWFGSSADFDKLMDAAMIS
jgi:hypothetical protein